MTASPRWEYPYRTIIGAVSSQPLLPTNHWYNVLFQDRSDFEAQLGRTETYRSAKAITPSLLPFTFLNISRRLVIFCIDILLAVGYYLSVHRLKCVITPGRWRPPMDPATRNFFAAGQLSIGYYTFMVAIPVRGSK
jgi:hypothetical protein